MIRRRMCHELASTWSHNDQKSQPTENGIPKWPTRWKIKFLDPACPQNGVSVFVALINFYLKNPNLNFPKKIVLLKNFKK